MRAGPTFASRTYAELAALTADLPAGLTGAKPPRGTAKGTCPAAGGQGSKDSHLVHKCDPPVSSVDGRFAQRY